jgi:Family of unknown function (DUF6159)
VHREFKNLKKAEIVVMNKFSRSWSLVKASATVLKQDKELMMFPLFSSIAAILVAASFLAPLLFSGAFDRMDNGEADPALYVYGFVFYLVQYFVMFFFNAALVGAAMIRLEGGDPTVADGLRIARSKWMSILGYAAIAATIGLILRAIEERAGFIGKWIAGLLGAAFTVATFLTVPILVSRDIGPIDAVKNSASLLKETWGENIIGNAGLGLFFTLLYFGLLVLGAGAAYLVAPLESYAVFATVGTLFLFAFIALALVHAALQGVYAAALYRYASNGAGGDAFDNTLLNDAFRLKA